MRYVKVQDVPSPLQFRLSQLALKYCTGEGIEIGASAHNRWGLENCINVSHYDDFEFYKTHQISDSGSYADVDVWAEAWDLPFTDDSKDYILSSHVVEHLPNPIAAFWEWTRVLKPDGIVYMAVPLRDAHPPDRLRFITPVEEIYQAYIDGITPDTYTGPINRHGHYYVWTLTSMLRLIDAAQLPWDIVETEKRDSKVGNSFTVVARKR